jgi:MFS family permease
VNGRSRAAVASVLLAGFLGEAGYALLLLPLLQHFLVFERHFAPGAPGLVLGAYGLSRLVTQIPMGYVDEALNPRLLLGSGYLIVLVAGLLLWAPLPLAGLAVVAVIFGLGHALADPLLPAGLAAAVKVDGRGRVLSYLNLAQVAGLAVGLAGGAFITDLAPASVGFLTVAAAHALILPLLVFGAAPLFHRRRGIRGNPAGNMWRALSNEQVLEMLIAMFALALALNIVAPEISVYTVQRLHTSLHVMTLYLVPAAVAAVIALPLSGWLSDRYGRLPPLLAGAAMGAAAFLALSLVRSSWQAAIAAVFGAAGATLTLPASGAALLDVAGANNRALLLSGMMAAQGLAEAVGPLLGGVLTDAGGVAVAMAAAAAANWVAIPAATLFGSAPTPRGPGRVIPYTPLTRLISGANVKVHQRRATRGTGRMPVDAASSDERDGVAPGNRRD